MSPDRRPGQLYAQNSELLLKKLNDQNKTPSQLITDRLYNDRVSLIEDKSPPQQKPFPDEN